SHRVGQGFPWVPDVSAAAVPEMVESGASWICRALVPFWVYKLFRLEVPGKEKPADILRGNMQLFQFMSQVRSRHRGLGRVLSQFVATESDGPMLFGGCYLGGTGREPRNQAFVPGVLDKLTKGVTQNLVYWTPQALAE